MAATLVMRPAAKLWRVYNNQLARRPLLTRCLTGVVGASISDALAQHAHAAVVKKRALAQQQQQQQQASPGALGADAAAVSAALPLEGSIAAPYNWPRTARLAAWSCFVGTPLAIKWFDFLDKVSTSRTTGQGAQRNAEPWFPSPRTAHAAVRVFKAGWCAHRARQQCALLVAGHGSRRIVWLGMALLLDGSGCC
jgi:hypothetical protein